MANYAKHVGTRGRSPVSQTMRAKKDQVKNNDVGYVFDTGLWTQFDRFLILGAEGPTYYATEQKMVVDNVASLTKLIATVGTKVVDRIVEISEGGRAPKNDPALFALAICAASDNERVRSHALTVLPRVARTGTHLFKFVGYVTELRGWGRSLRKSIANWYTGKSLRDLVFQVMKYQSRVTVEGQTAWSHRDLLRLSHPFTINEEMNALFKYITKGEISDKTLDKSGFEYLKACEAIKRATNGADAARLVAEHRIMRENVPTQFMKDHDVLSALLKHQPMESMIRNLGNMTANGIFTPLSDNARRVVDKLSDAKAIRDSRLHPVSILSALRVYARGQGIRGNLSWVPNQNILAGLENAFYNAFDNVEATGKNILVAIDCSPSMAGGDIAGVPGLSPRDAASALAMTVVRSERNSYFYGFSGTLLPLNINRNSTLSQAAAVANNFPWSNTDCALPVLHATKKKMDVDAFIIITDNETNANSMHPFQALREYRHKMNKPNAKMIVIGMTATKFTIADPSDPGSLDIVGFDTAAPTLISNFIRD